MTRFRNKGFKRSRDSRYGILQKIWIHGGICNKIITWENRGHLSPGRRLFPTWKHSYWHLGAAAETLLENTAGIYLYRPTSQRWTGQPPIRNWRSGRSHVLSVGQTTGGAGGYYRATNSWKSDGVGGADELRPKPSGGNYLQWTDLRLILSKPGSMVYTMFPGFSRITIKVISQLEYYAV